MLRSRIWDRFELLNRGTTQGGVLVMNELLRELGAAVKDVTYADGAAEFENNRLESSVKV